MQRLTGIPLYVQIRERLRSELTQMEPGDAIPVEAELVKRFGVSRITIRRAVQELADDGLLVRQQGRGTFVQKQKFTHELSLISSWSEQLRRMGHVPRTVHRRVSVEQASTHVAEALRLSAGQRVVHIERTRLAGREPISLMTNYLPEHLLPGFAARKLTGESLYEVLERDYRLVPAIAVDNVGAREATAEEASQLGVLRRSPVVTVRRTSYLEDGTPLELAVVASRGDRYQYQVTLRGRLRSNSSPDLDALLMGAGEMRS